MTRSDFKPGQTVYLLQRDSGNKKEDSIVEAIVLSVGRKYLTILRHGEIKFDMTNNFREKTIYTPRYTLYLTREAILEEARREKKKTAIELACRWPWIVLDKMSDDDLNTVYAIFEKYKA